MNAIIASFSIREQLLLVVLDSVRPAATSLGAGLHRSPDIAIARESSPALLVFPESETIAEHSNNRVQRELIIRLVAITRAVPPAIPETLADQLMTAAHKALMANLNLNGLAMGITEVDSEWDIEDADASAASFTTRYCIKYRTLATDLSVAG